MDDLVKLINEIFVAVYQIAPPSIQEDLKNAVDEYVKSQETP